MGPEAVRTVLSLVPDSLRYAIWLGAQERRYEQELLDALSRQPIARPAGDRPDAQIAFCIDVRSEGLRKRLENFGDQCASLVIEPVSGFIKQENVRFHREHTGQRDLPFFTFRKMVRDLVLITAEMQG